MKKIRNLLLSITLLGAAGAFALLNNQHEDVKVVEASKTHHITGIYERVNDFYRIQDGDHVIICIYNSECFSNFEGNPASAQFKSEGAYFSSDCKLLGLDGSAATEFEVAYHEDGSYFTFRGTMELDTPNEYDVLLAYNEAGCGPSIGSFTGDKFGTIMYSEDHLNDTRSHWKISNSENDRENILLKNVNNPDCARSYSIYRKAAKSFSENSDNIKYPNYYVGDGLILDGFYIDVTALGPGGEDLRLEYNDNAHMFYTTDSTTAVEGKTEYKLKLHGLPDQSFTFEINSVQPNPYFHYDYLEPDQLKDYRGTYLAVEQEEGNHYFNGRYPVNEDYNSTQCYINDGVINNASRYMYDNAIIIDKVEIDGKLEYVAKTMDLSPKYYNNPYYDGSEDYVQFIELTEEVSASNIIHIKENKNGGMTFGFQDKWDNFFGFSYSMYGNAFFFETEDRLQNARLYKINSNHYFDEEIEEFIQEFENRTELCDPTGHSRNIFDTQWEYIKSKFNTFSADVKGYIANMTYTHNKETAHTIQDIVDRYDYIITKYTDLEDFIGRKEIHTLVDNSSSAIISASSVEGSEVILMTTVIASILAVSLSTLVILKKKKR